MTTTRITRLFQDFYSERNDRVTRFLARVGPYLENQRRFAETLRPSSGKRQEIEGNIINLTQKIAQAKKHLGIN